MTEFMTLRRLEKHFERNHETFGQEDRGIKQGGLPESEEHLRKRKKLVGDEDMEEMYGRAIKGDILNQCYKCKTCGDLVNYRKYRWNNGKKMMGKLKIMKTMKANLKVVWTNLKVGRTNLK